MLEVAFAMCLFSLVVGNTAHPADNPSTPDAFDQSIGMEVIDPKEHIFCKFGGKISLDRGYA